MKEIKLKGTYKVEFDDKWIKVYDDKGKAIYYEDSDGYWAKSKYDEKGYMIYYVNSNGYWSKSEYDKKGDEVYFEDSYGYIADNRIKELTVKEIEKLLGYKIKIKGESK